MSVPSPADYLRQARANRDHAQWLLSMRPNDSTALQWAVTAIFYSALHGMSADLERQGVSVRSHASRNRVLVDPVNGVPHGVYAAYHELEDHSRDARYELVAFTTQQVRDLLDQELAAIATFVGM